MIKKLRIKFIALTMSLLFILLAVLIGVINTINYNSVVRDSDKVLSMLSDNDGAFPKDENFDRFDFVRNNPKELPYESRYFTVHLDSNKNIMFSDTEKIAAVDKTAANEYALEALESGKESGFLGDYRFRVKTDAVGSIIVFLDCGNKLAYANSFLLISCLIAFIGYIIVFALLTILSTRIVKPFADNYEKQKLFITDAGHEMKTPLTIISADVDVLETDIGENEWLKDIQEQTKRMADMTNELVYLSRMEESESNLQAIDFPLSDVVSEEVQAFSAVIKAKNKTLDASIEPMLSYCGDEKAFRRLISILMDNAVKYSGENGCISLNLVRTNRSILLTVNNTSSPLSEEDLKHLFDRFYRADKSRNTQTGGHGIGLAVAKAIVAAHKGTITATKPDDAHLQISISLPC